MQFPDKIKGYFYSLLAAFAVSNVYIFSKAAMREMKFPQFFFYWFGFASFWLLLYATYRKKFKLLRTISSRAYKIMIQVGMLEVLATLAFFQSINMADNPAIISFLANTTPIFVTILGVSFLKERFKGLETGGIILALAGALVLSYKTQSGAGNIFEKGSLLIVISCFIYATGTIIVRKNIKEIDVTLLSLIRALMLFATGTILILWKGYPFDITNSGLFNIAVGSFIGPFFMIILTYSALQYIEASRNSIVMTSRGIFVLFISYLYFGMIPEPYQIFGGLLTIAGVILISAGRLKKIKRLNYKQRLQKVKKDFFHFSRIK